MVTNLTNREFNRNGYDVRKEDIDGQWVTNSIELSTANKIGTYTISLSDYLPDDDYDYLVNIYQASDRSGDSDGKNSVIYINDSKGVLVCKTQLDGANWQQQHCNGLAIIDKTRKFTYKIANYNLTKGSLTVNRYKRLGKVGK